MADMKSKKSIQTTLIIILVTVVTSILAAFGVQEYFQTCNTLTKKLTHDAELTASRLAIGMVAPLWEFDETLAEVVIASEMRAEDVATIMVWEGDGKTTFIGREKVNNEKLSEIKEFFDGNMVIAEAEVLRGEKRIGVVKVGLSPESMERTLHSAIVKIAIRTLVIVSLLIITLFFVVRIMLICPIKVVEDFARKVSEGNLDAEFGKARFSGELGRLRKATESMVMHLKETITSVQQKESEAADAANEAEKACKDAEEAREEAVAARREGMLEASGILKGISESIMAVTEDLSGRVDEASQRTDQQRERATETATAMEEMNTTVFDVARNASEAASSAEASHDRAAHGSTKVVELVSAISEVKQQAESMKDSLHELGKHAEGIGQIMNVINDIADQTNLLALNAAIEAARAGEAGRGFAVVADEVRKLAEKTMDATKEVESAVISIQNSSQANIEGMDNAAEAIGNSTIMAEEAGEALQEIVETVDATSDQVRSIATASEQQSASSEEINSAMEDINTISTTISEEMLMANSSIQELSGYANQLVELIDKLENDDV